MGSRFIPTVDELRRRLRRAGLRTTTARLAVLRVLASATEPLSQRALTRAVADELFDRATIYRNLVELSRVGLVARSGPAGRGWRFELRRPGAAAAPAPSSTPRPAPEAPEGLPVERAPTPPSGARPGAGEGCASA